MSNIHSLSMGEGPENRPHAVVQVSSTTPTAPHRCNCPREERIPLSKVDRKDPILRSYLASPAPPSANVVSPLRTQARREAAGIGFAVWAFFLILFIIALGNLLFALGLSIVGGFIARFIVEKSRERAVRQDENVLAEQARAQQDVYNARRAAWERLSYCPTDRCVVNDETGESRPLHTAHELMVLTPVASHSTNHPA
jgi:hypothetical protein